MILCLSPRTLPVLKLRLVSMDDARLLFEWRNDPFTRKQSHSMEEINFTSHLNWLRQVLSNPDRKLYIAELGEAPVGTLRADTGHGTTELSWTVAPEARGKGVGKQMVHLLVSMLKGPLRAEVKTGNVASIRIAEHCGFQLEKEINGILHFSRRGVISDDSREG